MACGTVRHGSQKGRRPVRSARWAHTFLFCKDVVKKGAARWSGVAADQGLRACHGGGGDSVVRHRPNSLMCVCGGAVRERVLKRLKREFEEALRRARVERGPQEFVQEGIRRSFKKTLWGGGGRKGLFKRELEEALKRPLWGRGFCKTGQGHGSFFKIDPHSQPSYLEFGCAVTLLCVHCLLVSSLPWCNVFVFP